MEPVQLATSTGGERRSLRRAAAEVPVDSRAPAAPAGRGEMANLRGGQLRRRRQAHNGGLNSVTYSSLSRQQVVPLQAAVHLVVRKRNWHL